MSAIPDFYYPATNESILSIRTTLEANWLLYVLLCTQPFLTLVVFLIAILFYSTPITKGFGLLAIIAGVDMDSLDVVQGAALSGKCVKPVSMEMGIHKAEEDAQNQFGPGMEHIQYTRKQFWKGKFLCLKSARTFLGQYAQMSRSSRVITSFFHYSLGCKALWIVGILFFCEYRIVLHLR